MTRISYIHGIGRDEIQDRAAEVKPLPYFNPMLMSEGQAYLTLMRDQVLTLAQYFPDKPIYRKGLSLIDNALHKGVNGITPAIGAVEPTLYPVMNAIKKFKDRRYQAVMPSGATPAAVGSWASQSMVAGIGADEGIPAPPKVFGVWWMLNDPWIKKQFNNNANALEAYYNALPDGDFTRDGKKFSEEALKWRRKYDTAVFVVDLYNEKIEKFAHHPLYNFLPSASNYPAAVVTKNILHQSGVQSCANAGSFSNENMSLWVRNGILRQNIKSGAGAISPEQTAFLLTQLPASEYGNWLNGKPAGDRTRGDATKVNGSDDAIGNPLAIIVPVIVAAIAAAATIATAMINQGNTSALSATQGWGTPSFAAGESDWQTYQQQLLETQQAGPAIPTPVLLGGAGLAAYLLLSK